MASRRIELNSMADFLGKCRLNTTYGKKLQLSFQLCFIFSYDRKKANAGGLFGLFMGASLLSLIEFIYYFTLRLFYARRAERSKTKLALLAKPKIFTVLQNNK